MVEQGQGLQDRVARQDLRVGRVPDREEQGGPVDPTPELLVGLCARGWCAWAKAEGGGFCFEVIRSSSRRADALEVPTALASLAQVLGDRGPH